MAFAASVKNSQQACKALRTALAKKNLAPHGMAEYRCDFAAREGRGEYFVFAVRGNFPPQDADANWEGSSLVGWYAVRKTTGRIYYWDVGDQAIGSLLEATSNP